MFGSVVLEVAIGLAFLYLLLSTVCSAANEWLAGLLALRGSTLSAALRNLLDDSTVDAIYAHPLIQGLSGSSRLPSYIPARVFATTLLDVLNIADVATGPAAAAAVRARVDAIPNAKIRGALQAMLNQFGNAPQGLRRSVELWFHDAMDRASGMYKRRVQVIIFVLAAVITVVLNADTLTFANRLAQDPALVARVASAAQTAVQPPAPGAQPTPPSETQAEADLVALQLPIGWSLAHTGTDPRAVPTDVAGILSKLLGLLFTAAAVSLGAPFWFDFLGRLVNLRLTGQPPQPPDPAVVAAALPQAVQVIGVAPAATAAPAPAAGSSPSGTSG
ncbi:MAG TPA: hypothetical protein VK587_09490 [bacterium]|nr:hypothetical protein [bacterium]